MRVSLAVGLLLMVVVLLTADSQAGWVRKTLRKVGKATKNIAKSEAVKVIGEIVRRHGGALVSRVIGKRSADRLPRGAEAQEMDDPVDGPVDPLAQDLLRELELACTRLSGLRNQGGLTSRDLNLAFGMSDDDQDGKVESQELDLLENILDAADYCVGLLEAQGK